MRENDTFEQGISLEEIHAFRQAACAEGTIIATFAVAACVLNTYSDILVACHVPDPNKLSSGIYGAPTETVNWLDSNQTESPRSTFQRLMDEEYHGLSHDAFDAAGFYFDRLYPASFSSCWRIGSLAALTIDIVVRTDNPERITQPDVVPLSREVNDATFMPIAAALALPDNDCRPGFKAWLSGVVRKLERPFDTTHHREVRWQTTLPLVSDNAVRFVEHI